MKKEPGTIKPMPQTAESLKLCSLQAEVSSAMGYQLDAVKAKDVEQYAFWSEKLEQRLARLKAEQQKQIK